VSWSVDGIAGGNTVVGAITADGLYVAPASGGSHSITATSTAQAAGSATASVSVVAVAISPVSATTAVEGQQQFTATVTGSNDTGVNWAVDNIAGGNDQVGFISTSGLYTAPNTGGTYAITATSTALAASGSTSSVSVIAVVVSPASISITPGSQQQFAAKVSGTTNANVVWSVDGVTGGNTMAGAISTAGLYEAPKSGGSHTITAASVAHPASTGTGRVDVVAVSISPGAVTVAPGGQQQFTATVTGASNTAVNWTVDAIAGGNAAVGTISSSGVYLAPGTAGSHAIVATSAELPASTAGASINVVNVVFTAPAVLTYHNDSQRTGLNSEETRLTTANVNSTQFGKLFSYSVDGQIYAQPLFMPALNIAGGTHNVLFVATENNSVYALDADGASTPLWHVSLGKPQPSTSGITPVLGVTSTPVIDSATGTLFVVNFATDNHFHLHALDIYAGAEKFGGPVVINAQVNGTGANSVNGIISLSPSCYQRTGLLLSAGRLYFGFGHCSHGWFLAYDAKSLAQLAVFNNTPDGVNNASGTASGGIWMSGGGAAVDGAGDVYVMSGNGDFNVFSGGIDYGDSFLKFDPSLNLLDYFAPSDAVYLGQNDIDLGSGGPMLLPANSSSHAHEVVGGGKYGRIYLLDAGNMGGYNSGNNDANAVQCIPSQRDGVTNGTHSIYCTPAYWNGMIYLQPENDVMRVFTWANGLLSSTPTAVGTTIFGVHGATPSISANGNSNGIVWVLQVDQVTTNGPAILHAYDAFNITNELYNSTQAGARDTAGPAVKFTVPTVVNGHVYVGTATEVDVYGLLN
jgi:hypothetical protein